MGPFPSRRNRSSLFLADSFTLNVGGFKIPLALAVAPCTQLHRTYIHYTYWHYLPDTERNFPMIGRAAIMPSNVEGCARMIYMPTFTRTPRFRRRCSCFQLLMMTCTRQSALMLRDGIKGLGTRSSTNHTDIHHRRCALVKH